MMELSLPLFDDAHRALHEEVRKLCEERLAVLASSELEDPASIAVDYIALLGQEGLFDPALGGALEGEAPRPDLRSLCVVRSLLGRTSGLCDGAFGAHVQGLYPIALCGNEDQRAIHLPGMASGQTIVAVALLDGDPPCVVSPGADGGYILNGSKQLVALAPIASQLVVLARHKPTSPTEVPRYSMFVVDAGHTTARPPPATATPMRKAMMRRLDDMERPLSRAAIPPSTFATRDTWLDGAARTRRENE